MKTVLEFNSQISRIEEKCAQMKPDWFKSKEDKSLNRQLKNLKWYRNYLETNPTEESIKSQITLLNNRIDSMMGNFKEWGALNKNKHDNPLSAFKKEMGIGGIKQQIKRLHSLL